MFGGRRWSARAVARPRTTLTLAVLVVLLSAPGLTRLELQTDGHALVPPEAPVVAADARARDTFDLRDPLLVVIETDHPDGVWNTATLGRVVRLQEALAALPELGADHVVSLASETSPRRDPTTRRFRRLLEPFPTTAAELGQTARDVEAIDPLLGTLLSYDRRATALLVGVPRPEDGAGVDRRALYHQIAALAAAESDERDRISVVGAPAAEALLGEHVLADLKLLVPLSLAVIGGVLWLAGGWGAAMVGLIKVGAAQIFTFGIIGWSGQPIYLTTAILPILLTTVGLSDEIHLVGRFRRRGPDEAPTSALGKALDELVRPITLTSLTSAAGFASFLLSDIAPVRHFGLFAAVGVLFCLFWALTATPALLVLRPSWVPARPRHSGPSGFERLAQRLAGAPGRLVLAGAAGALALLVVGLPRLTVQDGWIDNFAPDSDLRTATDRLDRRFGGSHVLRAVVTFEPPPGTEAPRVGPAQGPLLASDAMFALDAFEKGLAARPEVGAVLGLPSQLATTSFLYSDQMASERRIDRDPAWLYLLTRRIGFTRGDARRRELVDDDFSQAALTLLLPRANYRSTAELMAAGEALAERHLTPVHGRLEWAGDVAVSQTMIPALVRGQLWSLGFALGANLLLLAWAYRSLAAGAAATAPALVAVAITFGLMGATGLTLGVASSVFAAVTLGIGVDYGIHFLERMRAAPAGTDAGAWAVAEAGPAILTDSLAISLGFGLLVASSVPPNRTLGMLVATGLILAALTTVLGGRWLARGRTRVTPIRQTGIDGLVGLPAGEPG